MRKPVCCCCRDIIALDFEAALGKVYFPVGAKLRLSLEYTGQLHPGQVRAYT